jgi:ElaB/YqjD/DUF883 family membrane-anchored ribosome-binding protein
MNASVKTNESANAGTNGAAPSEISNLIADIEEVLGRAAHVVDLDVTRLRETLNQKLAAAKSGLSEGGRRIAEAARTAAGTTDAYVHRSPWQAIGIAAIAGAAAGYLLARR